MIKRIFLSTTLLQVILIALKVGGILHWTWPTILAPWIILVVFLVVAAIIYNAALAH